MKTKEEVLLQKFNEHGSFRSLDDIIYGIEEDREKSKKLILQAMEEYRNQDKNQEVAHPVETNWDADENELYKALQEICFLFSEYHKAKEIATKAMAKYKYPGLTGNITTLDSPPTPAKDWATVFDENAEKLDYEQWLWFDTPTSYLSKSKFLSLKEKGII